MTLAARIRTQLARRAPSLEEKATRTAWRLRNRDRAAPADLADPRLAALSERLCRDGVVVAGFDELLADQRLWNEAAAAADELYAQPRERTGGEGKASFLTKLATGPYDADHPFVRVAVHPSVLAVANDYLRLRGTLRALELWLTAPTPGPAIETQLWHRDADDVMNVKLFVYFSDVTEQAGPLCYAPGSHPLGSRRQVPEHDERGRSTDEQLARVVPEPDWRLCEGKRGTIVLADTCGYHKQLKPRGDERLLLVAHYVSGTPFVPRVLELRGFEGGALTDDQYVAVHDRPRD